MCNDKIKWFILLHLEFLTAYTKTCEVDIRLCFFDTEKVIVERIITPLFRYKRHKELSVI